MTSRRRRPQGELRRYRKQLVAVTRDAAPLTCVEPAPWTGTGSAVRDTNSRGAVRR